MYIVSYIRAHICIVFFSFFFLQDKCFSLMPRTVLSRDTPCEERLVSARTSYFFRESLADLIIYPTRLKRRLRENPFLVSSATAVLFVLYALCLRPYRPRVSSSLRYRRIISIGLLLFYFFFLTDPFI